MKHKVMEKPYYLMIYKGREYGSYELSQFNEALIDLEAMNSDIDNPHHAILLEVTKTHYIDRKERGKEE